MTSAPDLVERLRKITGRWALNSDGARVSVKLGLLRELDDRLESLSTERDEWEAACDGNTALGAEIAEALRSALAASQAEVARLTAIVEQAFRDGMVYATNVRVTDPDEAWRTSRARSALQAEKKP